MVDYYDAAHTANWYNTELRDHPTTLLRRFPLHPDDDAGSFGVKVGESTDPSTLGLSSTRTAKIKEMDMQIRKVAYLNVTRVPRGHTIAVEGAGTLMASASYTANASHVPAYYLPWDQTGAVVRLQIPQKGTRAAHFADPDLFITAAINGCSVFVKGPRNAPEVFHCGGSTETPSATDGANFWRSILANSSFAPGVGGSEVNKTDYITEDGVMSTGALPMKTTTAAKNYKAWLENQHSSKLHIEEVRPWGCVMGVRDDAGDWTFYLQKNATVTYTVLRKFRLPGMSKISKEKIPGWKGGKSTRIKVDMKRSVCRPIAFDEIYPNAVASAFIPNSVPTAKHG